MPAEVSLTLQPLIGTLTHVALHLIPLNFVIITDSFSPEINSFKSFIVQTQQTSS